MGKNKLARFADIQRFENVVETLVPELVADKFTLKGNWKNNFFKNQKPIVLELGCGRGEYSVGLSKTFSDKNFLGVDKKGARLWRGAKTGVEEKIENLGFLRTRIELIDKCFDAQEIDEIWITFPDPREKESESDKRLVSTVFLEKYSAIAKENAIVHLKTDNQILYNYTCQLIELNNLKTYINTDNLYATKDICDNILEIKTHYEAIFSAKGMTIKYIKFELPKLGTKLYEPEKK